ALYLDPTLFQIRLLLADCLLRLGRRERAEHQYREVLTALAGGRARALAIFDDLPLPDRERALRRCRQALQAGGNAAAADRLRNGSRAPSPGEAAPAPGRPPP